MEILLKTSTLEERAFYIHQALINHWDKYALRDYLKADLYHHQGQLPNNFALTLPKTLHAQKAISMFKDEYLLDFVNVKNLTSVIPRILTSALSKIPLSRCQELYFDVWKGFLRTSVIKSISKNLNMVCGWIALL
jgi:Protein of unknown function (DUF1016).